MRILLSEAPTDDTATGVVRGAAGLTDYVAGYGPMCTEVAEIAVECGVWPVLRDSRINAAWLPMWAYECCMAVAGPYQLSDRLDVISREALSDPFGPECERLRAMFALRFRTG